ncbi:MAG: nicotinate-nucleotide adenylyltransferase [Clostridiales bacterium]|nr:nicotinate-nucleotide adenylyltransferase [Clostridiales bacterium]
MKKIGIIGGTFDPIHYGHLLLAEQARDILDLQQVVFIPARTSPFKKDMEAAAGEDRYQMVLAATAGNNKFRVSKIELEGPEISYTYYTLLACEKELGDDSELYFICGTDSFLSIEKWIEADKILKKFPLIVGSRPGYKQAEVDNLIKHLTKCYGTRVYKIDMPKVDISSTDIKNRIREGRSIKYLVPETVEKYIYENRLYQ